MICYIGIGSNLGDREQNITRALELLKASSGLDLERLSPVYETEPWGPVKDQGDYLNLVAQVRWERGPGDLLRAIKGIERDMGRSSGQVWGPRSIDLDLLYFGVQVVQEDGLSIPHPRIPERFFVLKPMSDLAPGWKDPRTNETIDEMLKALAGEGRWKKYGGAFLKKAWARYQS
ncbi:MAG: 2-amino-4-hydroxy-6-hydroxymethyldihydropteridine diphosphokinase [Candidatus Omnitrophota bacterium]